MSGVKWAPTCSRLVFIRLLQNTSLGGHAEGVADTVGPPRRALGEKSRGPNEWFLDVVQSHKLEKVLTSKKVLEKVEVPQEDVFLFLLPL